MTCRLCGAPSRFVARYDATDVAGAYWANALPDRTVEIRKCEQHGSYFTANVPPEDMLVGQYRALNLGEYYSDPHLSATGRARRCAGMLAQITRPGMRILDVGGGDGSFALTMRDMAYESWFQDHGGIPELPGVNVVQDVRDAPDESFDVVSVWDVLEHVWPLDTFLATLRRKLAPGGRLVVEVPSPSRMAALFVSVGRLAPKLYAERALSQVCGFSHVQLMTASELRAVLKSNGFDVAETREISELSYRGEEYARRLLPSRALAKAVGAAFDVPLLRRGIMGTNKVFAVAWPSGTGN